MDQPTAVGDDLTIKTISEIQREGVPLVGGAKWRGEWVMRLSVVSGPTTEADVDRSVDAILTG